MDGLRAMRLQGLHLCFLVFASLGCLVCGAREDGLRFGAGQKAWHHENFEKLKAPVLESAHSILHYRTETPLQVPLEVNVVLVGFSKNGGYRYHLDESKLEAFLHLSYPSRRPSCLETHEQLEIEHPISFNVIQADSQDVLECERALRKAMVRTGGRQEPGRGTTIVSEYTVEATAVEPAFDRLYEHYFNMQPTVKADRGPEARPPPTAIFIFNFDKVRMDPSNPDHPAERGQFETPPLDMHDLQGQEAGYVYQYRYMGGGTSQTWIAAGRYMVVDLSAGPCQYGRMGSDEGSISKRSIPRLHTVLEPFLKNPSPAALDSTEEQFQALLSHVIVSAIEFVIAPDVQYESLDVTHRVLVPVVALRNHHLFHPLRRDDPHAIDITAVEREVRRLVQPDQEVVVVGGMHSLHEHEHLAVAVSKAMRSDSLPDSAPAMHFQVKTRDYLDGDILMDGFRHSSDMLAAGLLDMTNPDLAKTFFYHDYAAEIEDSSGNYGMGVVKGKDRDSRWRRTMTRRQARPGPETASDKKKKLKKKKKGPEAHVAPMYGTRLVPVFVLSLAGVDSSLLMDGESALETAHDAVIVLQTPNGSVPVSYMSGTKRQVANTADPTREIVAGIAAVLGGIAAPYEKVSKVHQRREENWMWANGHHPFGPFSNCTSLSMIMIDVSHRNSIYSKVDVSLHGIRESLDALQAFADKFFATPLGSPVAQPLSPDERPKQWIDLLYADNSMPAIMPQVLLKELEAQLNKIEEALVEIGGKLYDHQLDDAHTLSEELLEAAHSFHSYVTQGLQDATDEMRCCALKHKKPMRSSSAVIYAGILFAGFIVYFLVIYFASPER